MGQREKARAIVSERFEFSVPTKVSQDGVIAAIAVAAEASRSKLGGRVTEAGVAKDAAGAMTATCVVKGVGGVLAIMVFTVTQTPPAGGVSTVSLQVGEFAFDPGKYGMKPAINAGRMMTKFVTSLKEQLAAG